MDGVEHRVDGGIAVYKSGSLLDYVGSMCTKDVASQNAAARCIDNQFAYAGGFVHAQGFAVTAIH